MQECLAGKENLLLYVRTLVNDLCSGYCLLINLQVVTCSIELLEEALPFNQPFLSIMNTQREENVCDITYVEVAAVVLCWNHTQNNYLKN